MGETAPAVRSGRPAPPAPSPTTRSTAIAIAATTFRARTAIAAVALATLLAGCSGGPFGLFAGEETPDDQARADDPSGEDDDAPEQDDDGPGEGDDSGDDDRDADDADDERDADEDDADDDGPGSEGTSAAAEGGGGGPAPVDGDPTTRMSTGDGEPGQDLAVTDVRIGSHDGFDRVVFEIHDAGDGGEVGWYLDYVDEARAQGSGQRVDVDGDAVLEVGVRNVALPPQLPDDVEVWDESPLAGPDGDGIVEVVDGNVFEGQHQFFVGATDERPYVVERLDDPQRLVIDVLES